MMCPKFQLGYEDNTAGYISVSGWEVDNEISRHRLSELQFHLRCKDLKVVVAKKFHALDIAVESMNVSFYKRSNCKWMTMLILQAMLMLEQLFAMLFGYMHLSSV